MFSGIVSAAPPYIPDAETILLYHFDESAGSGLPQDSSLYSNDATSGQQATGDIGLFGNAIAFTNTNISIPDDPSFDKAQTNGTVEFWIKFNTEAINYWGSDYAFISKNNSGNNMGDFTIGYRMNPIANGGGQIYLFMETGTGTYRMLRTPGLIKTTDWYHVVVSWDSVTKPTITVDDASQSLSDHGNDSSYVGPIFTASSALTVGAQIDFAKAAPGASILMDELRLIIPPPPDTNRPAITYVVEPGTAGVIPTASYTNWATAATNIQDAINAVENNGTVLVSNGTYTLSASLEIDNGITVRSYNNGSTDRAGTIINGNYPATTNRCVYIAGVGTTIDGFTITNGYASVDSESGNGGGVYIYLSGTVTNCLIAGNEAGAGSGGGIYLNEGGQVTMCTISGNVATNANAAHGGGVYFYKAGLVTNSLVSGNIANKGGGVWFNGLNGVGGQLIDSTVANNKAFVYVSGQGAAGIGSYFKGIIDNCSIVSNTIIQISGSGYNAGVQLSYYAIMRNSLVAYNTGGNYGGGVQVGSQGVASNCVIRNNSSNTGGGVYLGNLGLLQDCTVVSNSAAVFCQGGTARNSLFADNNGGIWVQSNTTSFWQNCTVVNNGGTGMRFDVPAIVDNCIVYDSGGANWSYNGSGTNTIWTSSCTTPELTGPNDTGNITNNPLFANAAGGNYRLTSGSPCINTGTDQNWMVGAVDLDGNPRIVGSTVDMGAYEYPPPLGTLIIVH